MREQLDKMLNHCQGCKYFDIENEGDREIFRCSLLEDEVITHNEDADDEYIPDGTEGHFAVAEYGYGGELKAFYFIDSYPESCPRRR